MGHMATWCMQTVVASGFSGSLVLGADFLKTEGSFVQQHHKRWHAESCHLPPLPAALCGRKELLKRVDWRGLWGREEATEGVPWEL